MESVVNKIGYAAAIMGFVLCAVAGVTRLLGIYQVLDFEVLTLLQGGTALMVLACMVRLYFPNSSDTN